MWLGELDKLFSEVLLVVGLGLWELALVQVDIVEGKRSAGIFLLFCPSVALLLRIGVVVSWRPTGI